MKVKIEHRGKYLQFCIVGAKYLMRKMKLTRVKSIYNPVYYGCQIINVEQMPIMLGCKDPIGNVEGFYTFGGDYVEV